MRDIFYKEFIFVLLVAKPLPVTFFLIRPRRFKSWSYNK